MLESRIERVRTRFTTGPCEVSTSVTGGISARRSSSKSTAAPASKLSSETAPTPKKRGTIAAKSASVKARSHVFGIHRFGILPKIYVVFESCQACVASASRRRGSPAPRLTK